MLEKEVARESREKARKRTGDNHDGHDGHDGRVDHQIEPELDFYRSNVVIVVVRYLFAPIRVIRGLYFRNL